MVLTYGAMGETIYCNVRVSPESHLTTQNKCLRRTD